MATIGSLAAKLTIDPTDFTKGIEAAESSLAGFGDKSKNLDTSRRTGSAASKGGGGGFGQIQGLLSAAAGGSIGGIAGNLGGILGQLGGSLGSLGAVAGPTGLIIGQVVNVLSSFKDKALEVINTMVGLAKVASPATFNRYQRALDDFQGVFGAMFVPAVEFFTDMIRGVADAIASSDLQGSFIAFWKELAGIFNELKPVIMVVTRLIADQVAALYRLSAAMLQSPLLRIAIKSAGGTLLGSAAQGMAGASAGAAARQASYVGVAEMGRQARLAAFSGSGGNPQERAAKAAEEGTGYLAAIAGVLAGRAPDTKKAVENAGGGA